MKTRTVVISLIALALSGCAHTGGYYQSSYGYTGYGNGGYAVERYYDYPASSYYYQPGGSMSFGTYSLPAYRDHDHRDHDRHGDRDRHDAWQQIQRRQDKHESRIQRGPDRGELNRWEAQSRLREQNQGERNNDRPDRHSHPSPSQLHHVERDSERSRAMSNNDFGGRDRHQQQQEHRRGDGERRRGLGFEHR